MEGTNAIPREAALQLCQGTREANRGRWYTLGGLQCWWCSARSGGDPDRRLFASRPDLRGCRQVNARFDTLTGVSAAAAPEPADGGAVAAAKAVAAITAESPAAVPAPAEGAPAVDEVAPAAERADVEEEVVEPLPIFGQRASRAPAEGWIACADCGRLFRPAAGQQGARYCPTCEYRRLRQQLSEQDTDSEGGEEE